MPYHIREVAERANVPEDFVRRLVAVGALPGGNAGLGPREVRRARLLHSWEAAGLSVETIIGLVDQGSLSLAFLDAPVMATPARLDTSHEQLAADRGVPVAFLQAVRVIALLERAIFMLYRRHREHVWTEHAINHVEEALERTGRQERVPQPPAICFAAHVGIHTGPVISQDGDVYGRTVNLAARIAAYARAGQVVVCEETAHRSGDQRLRLAPLGAVGLKGVAQPLPLYQAFRREESP